MLPAPWSLRQALDPLLQRDLWWQWDIFPLLSSLVPLRILPLGAPGAGQQQDFWAAWAPPGHAWSLRTLLLAPVTWRREEPCPWTSPAQWHAGDLGGEELGTKHWCSQEQERCMWSMQTRSECCGEVAPSQRAV